MNFIARRNERLSLNEFMRTALMNTQIDGIFLNITCFNGKIMLEGENITIQEFLRNNSNFTKKIILNYVCRNTFYFDSLAAAWIMTGLLLQYPSYNIYLCSPNHTFIEDISQYSIKNKIGFYITRLDIEYSDVDFYVLPTSLYHPWIVRQQVNRNKELMFYLRNIDDFNYLINSLNQEYLNKELSQEQINQIYLIADISDMIESQT